MFEHIREYSVAYSGLMFRLMMQILRPRRGYSVLSTRSGGRKMIEKKDVRRSLGVFALLIISSLFLTL